MRWNPLFEFVPAVVIALGGCFPFAGMCPAEERGERTSGVVLTHELAKEAVGDSDLNAMAAGIGIDYPVLLQRAMEGKRGAVFLLLWMAGNAGLDGAGAEGYSYTVVRAAKVIGDKALSEAARALDAAASEAVGDAFLFEYGGSDEPEAAVGKVRKEFPKLWAALSKAKGEADGGGERDVRAESK
jgi:hypothetical protein